MNKLQAAHESFCRNFGMIPPDSIIELPCACGYNGIMAVENCSVRVAFLKYRYELVCPNCTERTTLNFRAPLWPYLKKRFRTMLISATAAIALLAILAAVESPRMRVFNVLLTKGPNAAIEWLRDPVTAEEIFGRAWAFYTKGDRSQASTIARKLLEHRNISRKTLADTHYLVGLLGGAEWAESLNAFSLAIEMYKEVGALNSQFLATVGFAESVIATGNLEYGQQLLEGAEAIEASNPNLGDLYITTAMLNFWQEDYDLSIQKALLALDYFSGRDVNAEARVYSVLGLSQIAAGDRKAGLSSTIKADEIIVMAGLQRLWYYNQINYYLLARLSCQKADSYSMMFSRRQAAMSDIRLKRFQNFVESFTCTQAEKAGDGTSSPPPPD